MSFLKPVVIFALLFVLSLNAYSLTNDDDYYPGQLWVQLDPSASFNLQHEHDQVPLSAFCELIGEDLAKSYGLSRVRKPFHFAQKSEISEVYQLFFSEKGQELIFARALEQLSIVNYAERVPVMRPTLTPNDLGAQTGNNNQWSLYRVNAQDAWDITTAQNTEIVVAIVDDAVLVTHPDLIPNLVPGYDVASNNADPMPNLAAMTHGTHVAGIAGAATNNGIGIASIGFNVKIMPIKASNQSQTISDAYSGVIWAADNGANVINMSWGGSGFSNTGQNIINYAYSAGCVNVAAAGNDNTSQIFYPAGYDNVISVASTTTNDGKSGFSNYGSWIDVSAPGSAIRSTYFNNSFTPTYTNLQGTSMASPMVAGLCGLVWSLNPEMTQTQVTECVVNTADNIDGPNQNFIGLLGSGRINAFEAVTCAQAFVNAPPIATINTTNSVSCPGGLIQFLGSSAGGLATNYSWSFPGGNPATSTQQNPVVSYSSVGFYEVSLTVTNDFGEHTANVPGFIEVSSNGVDIFFSEDFEEGDFGAMGWSIDNPDNSVTWDLFDVAGSVSGSSAAGVNIRNYNATGQRDRLITPALNFSNHFNVQLDFQHAHRRFAQQFSDSLLVDVSLDGGETWPFRVLSAAETGQGTFATGTILNQNFVPANGNDWCFGGDIGSGCFTVDLSQFDGEENVLIRFETFNDGGNNIYIDNVELRGNCQLVEAAPLAGLLAPATTVCTEQSVQFLDQSVNVPTSYTWSFPGGQPETATTPAPNVVYTEPGTYTVTLLVENEFGSDEITFENYITVVPGPSIELSQNEATICVGNNVQINASGADSYFWSPNIGLSTTVGSTVTAGPTQNQEYTITATTEGCTAIETLTIEVLPGPDAPSIVSDDQVAFVVTEPAAIQGHYNFAPVAAGWGSPALNTVSIEAPLVIARDNAEADSLLCNAAVNAAEINGNIAVVYRGGCEFGTKALNAQNAGAIGVIVVNNTGEPELIEIGPGVEGANVTIPVMMVTQVTGAWLNAQINSGNSVAKMGTFNGGSLLICPNESVNLAGPGGWETLQWNTGAEGALVTVTGAGNYTVSVVDENGCATASESTVVTVAAQATPGIAQMGNTLSTSVSASAFQWYLNGEAIAGATNNSIEITEDGMYTVEAFNSIGCSAVSNPYNALVIGIEENQGVEISLYPNPANNEIRVSTNLDRVQGWMIYSTEGRLINQLDKPVDDSSMMRIDVSSFASGVYNLVIIGDAGSSLSKRFVISR